MGNASVTVSEVEDYSIKFALNASCVLQIPIGRFLVGHAFNDYIVQTVEFNADGTEKKLVLWTEDDLLMDLVDWADRVLSGYSDFFNVDGSKKEEYYRLDFEDTSTKIILFVLLFWIICAPIAMVWIAMKCCYKSKVHNYSKVDGAAKSE